MFACSRLESLLSLENKRRSFSDLSLIFLWSSCCNLFEYLFVKLARLKLSSVLFVYHVLSQSLFGKLCIRVRKLEFSKGSSLFLFNLR